MVTIGRSVLAAITAMGLVPYGFAQDRIEPITVPSSSLRTAELVHQAQPSTATALYNYYQQDRESTVPPITQVAGAQPDVGGLERLYSPTPVGDHAFQQGGHSVETQAGVGSPTYGIRLDTSYELFRDGFFGVYTGEDSSLYAAGATLLPFQTPGLVVGTRLLGGYNDNMTAYSSSGSFHLDAFAATRYKASYLKLGYFLDLQNAFGKTGVTSSGLLNLTPKGPLHGLTWDTAIGFGTGRDRFRPLQDPATFRTTRIEMADIDYQLRVGKFLSRDVQVGMTYAYLGYEAVPDESNWGAFTNLYLGYTTLGFELMGGHGGLHGFATVSFNWGKLPEYHPQDCRAVPVDTISWVTVPTLRDLSMRLRDSFTGPAAPAAP